MSVQYGEHSKLPIIGKTPENVERNTNSSMKTFQYSHMTRINHGIGQENCVQERSDTASCVYHRDTHCCTKMEVTEVVVILNKKLGVSYEEAILISQHLASLN